MSDKPSSGLSGRPTPVTAKDTSVVSTREITNVKGRSIRMKIEAESGPGSPQSANAVGQQYAASSGSVICADRISNVTVDGDIDFSVSVKHCNPVQGNSASPNPAFLPGTVDETLPPLSKGPAVEIITKHKVDLIECLMADHSFILQHVHSKRIITDREYNNMKYLSQPEETVTDLIDKLIFKGQESCSLFLEVLQVPDVLETYPQLKKMTGNF